MCIILPGGKNCKDAGFQVSRRFGSGTPGGLIFVYLQGVLNVVDMTSLEVSTRAKAGKGGQRAQRDGPGWCPALFTVEAGADADRTRSARHRA